MPVTTATVLREYRPSHFWCGNGLLEPDEPCRQIREMHLTGFEGFFMYLVRIVNPPDTCSGRGTDANKVAADNQCVIEFKGCIPAVSAMLWISRGLTTPVAPRKFRMICKTFYS